MSPMGMAYLIKRDLAKRSAFRKLSNADHNRAAQ
jgi:hypothetical protein